MIDRFISNIIRFKKVWGIHINDNIDQNPIHAVLLEYKKGSVHILENRQFNSIEEIINNNKNNIPVSLSYSGKKILSKKIEAENNSSLQEILHVSDINQFYIQLFQSGNNKFLSVIRKEEFDPILAKLRDHEVNLVSVVFEVANIVHLIPYINTALNKKIKAEKHIVHLDKETIIEINSDNSAAEEILSVGNEKINSDDILPFSNALAAFQSEVSSEFMLQSEWRNMQVEYKHSAFVKKVLPICLGVVLGILLLNFVLLQIQTDKYNKLSTTFAQYQGQLKQLENLTKDFNEKRLFLGELKLNDYKYYSYYTDRIAATLTKQVKLTSLVVNPQFERKTSRSNQFIFENNVIKIVGTCNSSSELNNWLGELEGCNFVDEINEQVFEINEYDEKGHFSFKLKISTP